MRRCIRLEKGEGRAMVGRCCWMTGSEAATYEGRPEGNDVKDLQCILQI